MSYKDGVKNLECLILRNEYRYNKNISSSLPIVQNVDYYSKEVPLPISSQEIIFTKLDDNDWGYNEPYGIPCIALQVICNV